MTFFHRLNGLVSVDGIGLTTAMICETGATTSSAATLQYRLADQGDGP
ncbi:hypothetical protein [Rhizobium sp. BR 249]